MKKTTCNVYLCKIIFFMAFTGVLLRTWTKRIKTSLFHGSFLQSWKKLLSGCSSNLVNCIGNSKIINPSVIYYSSPNELQRLSSFNSPHSLMIKTYCLPTRVPSTNTTQLKQWYSTYVMQSWKMLNVTN